MEIPPSRIELTNITVNDLDEFDIGKPVMRDDRGYKEYGILMGYNKSKELMFVHFNDSILNLRLICENVYFVTIKHK